MSFSRHGKSIHPMCAEMPGATLGTPPALIGKDESPTGYSLSGLHSCIARLRFTGCHQNAINARAGREFSSGTRTAATSALTFMTFS